MSFSLHLFLFFLSFYTCSASKLVGHKTSDRLKNFLATKPSYQVGRWLLQPPWRTLMFFSTPTVVRSQGLICSSFAQFCYHAFSVQPCRQLFVFEVFLHPLYILNKIQWPAILICSSLPLPPQMCVSLLLTSPSTPSTSTSLKSTNHISSLSYSSSFPLSSSSTSMPSYQSTTSKFSAPLPLHKLLILLSVAFGSLAGVLIWI